MLRGFIFTLSSAFFCRKPFHEVLCVFFLELNAKINFRRNHRVLDDTKEE
jgi:hypothetical protein